MEVSGQFHAPAALPNISLFLPRPVTYYRIRKERLEGAGIDRDLHGIRIEGCYANWTSVFRST